MENQITEQVSTSYMTSEETREILTPFAFELDKSLFGIRLASPWRRLSALLVDITLIALLSSATGELLSFVIAITLFKLAMRKHNAQGKKVKRWFKSLLFGLSALILLISLLNTLPFLVQKIAGSEETKVESELTLSQGVKTAALLATSINMIDNIDCQNIKCWQDLLSPQMVNLSRLKLSSKDTANAVIEGIVDKVPLTLIERAELQKGLIEEYDHLNINPEKLVEAPLAEQINTSKAFTNDNQSYNPDINIKELESSKLNYSIVGWAMGIIEDLGLGFGWAAFYFTVFTALWKGQTPGKKLFSIRVLQLDGSPLSLWDSFGRYGGYGAGIATGLLGFMQIFWDANRQAIHDKISSTIVIKKESK